MAPVREVVCGTKVLRRECSEAVAWATVVLPDCWSTSEEGAYFHLLCIALYGLSVACVGDV